MSKFYAESNNESTINLYNKRVLYRQLARNSVPDVRNIVDLDMGERTLYGKVDTYYSPMFVKYLSRLKPLKTEQDGPPYLAFNFVADLFNAMTLEFERCVTTGQISGDELYLSRLKVFKAFQDPKVLYKSYEQQFISNMKRKFNSANIRVENFDHFMIEFMKILRLSSQEIPFTFPAFVKSRFNSVMSTGLAIEIADLDNDNDEDKKNHFIQSKNWEFFVNACNKYGFMIDYNNPWRIICDIKAPHCRSYFQKYYYNVDELISTGFDRASAEYVTALPRQLLDIYNSVKKRSFEKDADFNIPSRSSFKKLVTCSGKARSKIVEPPDYTVGEILKLKGMNYFIETYAKLRLLEEKPEFTPDQTNAIIKDLLIHMNNTKSYLVFETHFERLINKPFDKPFSETYNMNIVIPSLGVDTSLSEEYDMGNLSSQAQTTTPTSGY